MFEDLKAFPRIVVSGPHRSGTTICGAIIAADTGHMELREESFGWSDEVNFAKCLARENVVLQAPFLAHRLHYLHQIVDPASVCVVFLKRDVAEIEASQARMLQEFGEGGGIAVYRLRFYHSRSPSPAVVYENWEEQKQRIAHTHEVDYESLRDHPLWVNDRSRFHYRQTR